MTIQAALTTNFSEFISYGSEVLKILPGAILFPFSIYFAWKKIGHNVTAWFTYGGESFVASRVTNITLTNQKDKPLPIFSIFLVLNKEIALPVEEFDPPVILKGLETVRLTTKAFSTYFLGSDKFSPDHDHLRSAEVFIATSSGMVKCKRAYSSSVISYAMSNDLRLASKETRTFNKLVYNDAVAYAITYLFNGEQKTALVATSGIIGGEWEFRYNRVPDDLLSEKGILKFLERCGYDKLFTGVSVDALNSN